MIYSDEADVLIKKLLRRFCQELTLNVISSDRSSAILTNLIMTGKPTKSDEYFLDFRQRISKNFGNLFTKDNFNDKEPSKLVEIEMVPQTLKSNVDKKEGVDGSDSYKKHGLDSKYQEPHRRHIKESVPERSSFEIIFGIISSQFQHVPGPDMVDAVKVNSGYRG